MALIEKFFVVAAEHPVGSANIKEGQIVTLNTSREVIPYAGTGVVLGIAGDTKSTSASAMPGIYDGWQNRANDSFNETGASGLMTVYESGGEFATDQYADNVLTLDPGSLLYVNSSGVLAAAATGADTAAVGVLTRAAGPYPSGVPGIDINGDMALKGEHTNQYIEFKFLR
jgi:hypothetical protein